MRQKIKQLEKLAMPLEPNADKRAELLDQVVRYGEAFLENLDQAPAYAVTEDKGIGLYDSPISEKPLDLKAVLKLLDFNVVRPGVNPPSAGYLAYIPSGGIYFSALGDYLAAITNRYPTIFFASPGATRMEHMLLRWMGDLVGYPDGMAGDLTSGGSIANLVGIVTAREAHNLKAKDFEKSVVYLTEQAHHSLHKALGIAGLRECIKRYITLDQNYRMQAAALEEAIIADKRKGLNPWLIIASAGTTDVGAVDPLAAIGDIAVVHNLWLHIDAAYGGFFALCDPGKQALNGLEKSASVVMDPHKGLFLPFGSGAVLVKAGQKLRQAHAYRAGYMQDALTAEDEISPHELSPELSRHFRGLRLWLPLKLLGLAPFRAALEEKLLLARYFHAAIQKIDGFEVGPYPDLSVVTYRYVPKRGDMNAFNEKLVQVVQNDGRVFLSSTMLDGRFTLRLAVLGFRTHLDKIDQTLEILQNKARDLAER